jgi:hypothetical protein
MGSHLAFEARNAGDDVILTWEFLQRPNRRFYWRAVAADGSVSCQSPATFASLDECAADARRMWTQREE